MDDTKEINRQTIESFREHRGGGPFEGRPLLLLTTTGRRTGRAHTTPMMYVPDGGRLLVFASCMGAPAHPHWYLNLVADPEVTVEVGAETYPATAAATAGEERDRLFAETAARHTFFTDHQAKTERVTAVTSRRRRAPGPR